MDFEFSDDSLMLRDVLRRFVQKEARPLEMDYFNNGELTFEQSSRLRMAIEQLGLWGITVPEKYGGGGLDMINACLIEEELGKTFIPVDYGEAPSLLYACTGDQIQRFLEPVLAGKHRAIVAAREPGPHRIRPETWTTSAIFNGERYLINGKKLLASMPDQGDFIIVLAKNVLDSDQPKYTAFILENEQTGWTVFCNGEITLALRDCLVTPDRILGEPGSALSIGAGEAPLGWIRIGARYVGIVERLIEMALEHARTWESLGEPLAIRPVVRQMLAEMRVDVESARWLVYHAAWLVDNERGKNVRTQAAQVRLVTGEMLKRAIDRVAMIFAGPGPSPQIEAQRMVKNAVPAEALEFALEHARAILAADMLESPKD